MESDDDKNLSNKPNPSPFHQQKLKGWQPIINTNNLYLSFFAIGLIFILIGSGLVYYSYQVTELSIDYTDCLNSNGVKCSDEISQVNYTSNYRSCFCSINITLPKDFQGPAFVYYGLTNFFQNHRRYVKSRDDRQLKGLNVAPADLSGDCEPFKYYNSSKNVAYAPCGVIANSLFNDTFQLDFISNNKSQTVPWTKTGIAWASETNVRYGQPSSWQNTVKPMNWPVSAQSRSSSAYKGDEELLVWMRSAALPKFKKLHRIINNSESPFTTGLPQGQYVLSINYSYPVTAFQGTKTFIVSETNYMGGKNPAMGITYLAVGTIYFSFGVAFLFINAFVARRYLVTDEEKSGRQNEAWYIATQSDKNGCSNETFCHVEAGDHSVFVDHSLNESNGYNL